MSFKANLQVDGKDFELLECVCELSQKHDSSGRPASGVNAGFIRFIIEGTDDDTFGSWIADPTKKKDGKITLFRIDQDSKFKEIEFTGGYLFVLSESFVIDGDLGMFDDDDPVFTDAAQHIVYRDVIRYQFRSRMSHVMLGKISAEKIKIDGVEHNNRW